MALESEVLMDFSSTWVRYSELNLTFGFYDIEFLKLLCYFCTGIKVTDFVINLYKTVIV